MSFGFAIGDFVALGRLAWGLYKQCKGASAEFAAVCNEVLSIHTALRELQDEVQNEDSILNRAGQSRQKELSNIVQNCTEVLRQLESLVGRYRSLGTSQKKVWDRVKFGDEGIQVIRNKLALHTSTLTLFLTSLGTGSLGRIEKKLDDIAADIRAGHHEPSVMTAVNDDAGSTQQEAWTFLCRELTEDFSREEIEAYKEEIKGYIKQLVEKGSLEEQVTSVYSQQRATNFSLSELKSIRTTPRHSPCSSSTSMQHHNSQWPSTPTVVTDSDSDVSNDNAYVSRPAAEVHTQRTIYPETDPPPNSHVSSTHVESAKSTSRFTEEAPTDCKDACEKLVGSESCDANRWGNRCNVGIEIGDDCCRVAAYDVLLQKSVSIRDEYGCIDIPTCVAFTPAEILVGSAARRQMAQNLDNTFCGFPVLLVQSGVRNGSIEFEYKKHECPSLRRRGPELAVFVPCRRRHYTVVELTAMLIRKCRDLAEVCCKSAAISISITSSFKRLKWRCLAEAAEIAGIESPTFVSSAVALACTYAIQHKEWSYHGQKSIAIVDAGTRGYTLSFVDIFNIQQEREISTSFALHSVKQLAVIIEDARHHFVRGEKQLNTLPGLPISWETEFSRFQSDTGSSRFDSISPILRMSKLVDEKYLRYVYDDFQSVFQAKGPPDVCIVTGDLSSSKAVQGIIRCCLSQKAPSSICLLPSLQGVWGQTMLPVHGAVNLALHQFKIQERFSHLLELRIQAENGQEGFMELLSQMTHNQVLNAPAVTVKLVPASVAQSGLFLAVYEAPRAAFKLQRKLLFEVAIRPATVAPSYTLIISYNQDCSISFQLCRYEETNVVHQTMVEAEINCSAAGFIDLCQGNFVTLDGHARRKWLLKEDATQQSSSAVRSRRVKPDGRRRPAV